LPGGLVVIFPLACVKALPATDLPLLDLESLLEFLLAILSPVRDVDFFIGIKYNLIKEYIQTLLFYYKNYN
jgi:hypothetical protein